MEPIRKKAAKSICILAAAAITLCSAAADTAAISGERQGGTVYVTIDTSQGRKRISRYIYGINNDFGTYGVYANAVKQSGAELSTYNWETNASNSGADGNFENSFDLVASAGQSRRNEPALLASMLVSAAENGNIPSKYVTLPMMGYVANDANGVILPDDNPKRWADVRFLKGGALSILPDVHDDRIYVDEYISYLVNSYGFASEGGINGYFLDTEPEKWAEQYSVLGLEKLTAKGLLSKSVILAGTAKKIDPTALVYGPSIGGLESFVNLGNPEDWEQYKNNYSWFIDYYLDTMRAASDNSGTRLLDVLDLHYVSEAKSVILEPIVGTNSIFANEERMQAVRVLWDSNYTENSAAAILFKQHTPIIPTVQASIRMYYPGTKLSFSEYNFGGGDDISGGIAEADALGVFGTQDVYMACLKPDLKNYRFQKAGINIYTNYDGNGSCYGNTAVYADNEGDNMSSVYASVNEGHEGSLKSVVINKSPAEGINLSVTIKSKAEFTAANVYSFGGDSSEIILSDRIEDIQNNYFEYIMDPHTVYLFEFDSDSVLSEDTGAAGDDTGHGGSPYPAVPEHVEAGANPGQTMQDGSADPDSPVEIVTSVSVVGTEDNGQTITEIVTGTVIRSETAVSPAQTEAPQPYEDSAVPPAVKITGIALVAAVIIAMVMILGKN